MLRTRQAPEVTHLPTQPPKTATDRISPKPPPFPTAVGIGASCPGGPAGMPALHIDSEYWSYRAYDPTASHDHTAQHLAADFSVARLDAVYHLLWWAGRQVPARPLHRSVFLGRGIAVVEQADLHLVSTPDKLFVKPLPAYLLDHSFWTAHICPEAHLYGPIAGFVTSWLWLVRYPSDFKIATEAALLPASLTWDAWRLFARQFAIGIGIDDPLDISKRYRYGELRLVRLDQIYRLGLGSVVGGYLYSYSSYGGFFRRKFAWLIVAFAYMSIVLSAMQVGLATKQLQDNAAFDKSSYGFAVLALVLPVAAIMLATALYRGLFLYHLGTTLGSYRKGRTRFSTRSTEAS